MSPQTRRRDLLSGSMLLAVLLVTPAGVAEQVAWWPGGDSSRAGHRIEGVSELPPCDPAPPSIRRIASDHATLTSQSPEHPTSLKVALPRTAPLETDRPPALSGGPGDHPMALENKTPTEPVPGERAQEHVQGPLVGNGGFESLHQAVPDTDGRVAGWETGPDPLVPDDWRLNDAYPGQIAIGTVAPHSGRSFVRIAASKTGEAHIYQTCDGLEAGRWYRVSAWARGSRTSVLFYEYFADRPIEAVTVLDSETLSAGWRLLQGYYRVPERGYLRSALAFSAPRGSSFDLDDVSLEPATVAEPPPGAPPIRLENDSLRLLLTPRATLDRLEDARNDKSYAANERDLPVFTAVRGSIVYPATSLAREGATLRIGFADPGIEARLRVTTRRTHLLFEVLSIGPPDVDRFTISLPVQRLRTVSRGLNATYDDTFGLALFGATENVHNEPGESGASTQLLRASCYRSHGTVGAKFVLLAAPWSGFRRAIADAERENGLPSPRLEGAWQRDSAMLRRSYFFVTGATSKDIGTIIDYARIGRFGAILFLGNDWLENTGHWDISTKNFPGGITTLRRAVDRIHRAGMLAGVHVYGPAISGNDPYVTPVPDPRLVSVPGPSLAEPIDRFSTTLILAGPPPLPPGPEETLAFPGRYLQVGDEIIRWGNVEPGRPFRHTQCRRGVFGTRPSDHAAGSPVRGLPVLWDRFLPDPDSSLALAVAANLARVVNESNVDFVYSDDADGIQGDFLDGWYYLNRLNLAFYRRLKRDVLYQTSNGVGTDLTWHIVPRAASADGHGDIKGYLDERWPAILRMADDLTSPDIGWYYWFKDVRPDQIEYVCAKALSIDAGMSIETSREALERLPQSRRMLEMIGRYERCRLSGFFPESVRSRLRETGRDFKLFDDGRGGWHLYRAVYEKPRTVSSTDRASSVWAIVNDRPESALLGFEIVGPLIPPTASHARGGGVGGAALESPVEGATRGGTAREQSPSPPRNERRGAAANGMVLYINGRPVAIPLVPGPGEALTFDGAGEAMLWKEGMKPGKSVRLAGLPLSLDPGVNRVVLTLRTEGADPAPLSVLLYRLWPMEE